MKRYIRTKDNKIFDTTQYECQKATITYEDTAIEYIVITAPNLKFINNKVTRDIIYLKKEDIVAESDDILDLIQVGDLVRIEFLTDDYDYHKGIIVLDEFHEDMETLIDDMKDDYIALHQLYTKQNDNYILVWDKERGVI